jgi:Gram-negative porin
MTKQGVASVQNGGAGTLVRANNTIGYFLPSLGGIYGQIQIAAAEGAPNGNKYAGGRFGYAGGPVNVAVAFGTTDITATREQKAFNVGGSYNLGFMTLMGQYHTYKINGAGFGTQKNAMAGVLVPLGAGTLKASYGKVGGINTSYSATQFAGGYVYDLSKRTAMYGHFSKISNKTGASFVASGSGPAFTAADVAAGKGSTAYEFGVRHSF